MIDIDHFKLFNDLHGHAFGDKVLAEVGAAIKKVTDDKNFCARYGSEEFVVLMPGISIKKALLIVERFLESIASTNIYNDYIQVSTGIAQHQSNNSYDLLLNKADVALIRAKNAGRDCVKA
jgi:diguanylate cyclase (GGDEF)-like protein